MPRERIKHGLNENAGGGLACPVCHSHEVWVTYIRAHTLDLAAQLDRVGQGILVKEDHTLGAVLTMDLACDKGHAFGITVTSSQGITKVITEWTEPDDER